MLKTKLLFGFFLILLFSSLSLSAGSLMTTEQAYKTLASDNGKESYIIGKFAMVHVKDPSIGNAEIVNNSADLNGFSTFSTRIELINTDKNKVYTIDLKPVDGSSTPLYYKGKSIEENTADPYWILKVPAGNYELGNLICSLSMSRPGYHDYRDQMINVPVSKIIKKVISINAQAKKIVYIGDYDTNFVTHICLNGTTNLYAFRQLQIDLKNNFEDLKVNFINGANDKVKEKLNNFEFVSAL